jgi:hypothetical protein
MNKVIEFCKDFWALVQNTEIEELETCPNLGGNFTACKTCPMANECNNHFNN